ncbi:MAG: hypothetical protein IKH11_09470 [Bacteroidales bacterium]|nr:hypothetical protein [Bacteroidales bacterium]
MKFKLFIILVSALILGVLAPSCKEKEITKEYMKGSLEVKHNMPRYVCPGQKYSFTAGGVTAPDGTDVGYSFSFAPTGLRDTLKNGSSSFLFVVPDTLGTFTLNYNAFPVQSSEKYYTTSGSYSFVIVSDNQEHGSISGVSGHSGDELVTIDGRYYYLSESMGARWLQSNLSVIKEDESGNEVFGRSYENSSAMKNVFGAYYTWEEALTACPAGWRLPSEADWVDLLKAVGAPAGLSPFQDSPCGAGKLMAKASFNRTPMWDYYRGVDIQDVTFSAIPVGYAMETGQTYVFYGYSKYACFWTSEEYGGKAVYRYIHEETDNVFVGTADKHNFAASVRCVK